MSDPRKRPTNVEADCETAAEREAAEYDADAADADREMFGDEVGDYGLGDIGNK
jgi:hypothetical protein